MSITWGTRPNTLRDARKSATQSYVLTGTSDESVARALALGYSPLLHRNLYRSDVELQRVTPNVWHVDVSYGTSEKKEPEAGEFEWGFDTTGTTKHMEYSLSTTNTYVPSGKATTNHKQAIGVDDQGNVNGVDVPDKAFKWHEKHQLLLSSYGFAYATSLGEYTGRVNSGTFRGFPAGSVRFDGASGGQSSRDPELLELTYRFSVSPNETGLSIGDITGIAKLGWDYLWVFYEQTDDSTSNKARPIPRQVNVERVHLTLDFSLLGIGTT